MPSRGRKPATGRYSTREELCQAIWQKHVNTSSSQADIARSCRVGQGVVAKILAAKEGYEVFLNAA